MSTAKAEFLTRGGKTVNDAEIDHWNTLAGTNARTVNEAEHAFYDTRNIPWMSLNDRRYAYLTGLYGAGTLEDLANRYWGGATGGGGGTPNRDSVANILKTSGAKGVLPTTHRDGLWYQDRAFTRPWKYPEDLEKQVEGALDPSGFPVPVQYGPDLLNGAGRFDSDAGWTITAPSIWSISGGQAVCTNGGSSLTRSGVMTVGKKYVVSYQVTAYSNGNIQILGLTGATIQTGLGWKSVQGIATTANLQVYAVSSNFSIDNITVQEVIEDWSWLGPNLVTNGGFDGSSNWSTPIAGASISGGVLAFDGATSMTAGTSITFQTPTLPIVPNRAYQVTYTITGGTTNPVSVGFSAGSVLGTPNTAAGTYTETLVATAVATISVFSRSTNGVRTGTIDNITVREIPGHPLIAPSAGAGMTATARVNLLQRAEDLSHSAWVKTRCTVSAVLAPNSTMTAWQITGNGASGDRYVFNTAFNAGGPYVCTFWLKKGTADFAQLLFAGNTAYANIDLTTGAITATAGSISISNGVDRGGGWFSFQATNNNASTTNFAIGLITGATAPRAETNSLSTSVIVWRPDIRLAIYTGPAYPDYQRVGDGTAGVFDYDHVGFPVRLEAQANGRGLRSAGTVNFTNTDALHAGAVVVKTSDAVAGLVMETSVNLGANSGSIYLGAPTSNNFQEYTVASRGSSTALARTINGIFPAPHIGALLASSDISTDTLNLSVNGTQAASSAADQGAGNYGDHVLNVGGRDLSGTPSLRFAGGMFCTPFIVDGNVVTQQQAAAMLQELAAVAGHTY